MKRTFFLIGIVVSMACVLFEFNPGTELTPAIVHSGKFVEPSNDYVPPLINKEEELEKSPPLTLIVFDEILIVDNTFEIDEVFIFNAYETTMINLFINTHEND